MIRIKDSNYRNLEEFEYNGRTYIHGTLPENTTLIIGNSSGDYDSITVCLLDKSDLDISPLVNRDENLTKYSKDVADKCRCLGYTLNIGFSTKDREAFETLDRYCKSHNIVLDLLKLEDSDDKNSKDSDFKVYTYKDPITMLQNSDYLLGSIYEDENLLHPIKLDRSIKCNILKVFGFIFKSDDINTSLTFEDAKCIRNSKFYSMTLNIEKCHTIDYCIFENCTVNIDNVQSIVGCKFLNCVVNIKDCKYELKSEFIGGHLKIDNKPNLLDIECDKLHLDAYFRIPSHYVELVNDINNDEITLRALTEPRELKGISNATKIKTESLIKKENGE